MKVLDGQQVLVPSHWDAENFCNCLAHSSADQHWRHEASGAEAVAAAAVLVFEPMAVELEQGIEPAEVSFDAPVSIINKKHSGVDFHAAQEAAAARI